LVRPTAFETSVFASGSGDKEATASIENENDDKLFENVAAAVVVPGFLTGADEFGELCERLTAKGIPTVAVPMPNWHWLPCLGGRSARPILERIDFTVQHLVANLETQDNPILADSKNAILNIPQYQYSLWDCYQDFRHNPGGALAVGGSSKVDDYPVVEPRGFFPPPKNFRQGGSDVPKKKIALIGHSAGGWISRVYLSASAYGGRSYCGSDYIHSLVTLGTPHANAPGPAFDGIEWINRPEHETQRLERVRSLGVAGKGFMGGDWGELTLGAYGFCSPDGSDGASYEGDGVTPIFSALGMPGAKSLTLEGVTHFCWSDVFGGDFVAPELTEDHRNGRDWYGSEGVVDQWASFIREACNSGSSGATHASSSSSSSEASESKLR